MILSEVAQYLHNNGIGTLATNLFYAKMPDVTEGVAVLDTGGAEPDHELPIRHPTFQILIRSASYATGKAKLEAIFALLNNQYNRTLVNGGTYFYYIQAIAEGGHIGENEAGEQEFSINFKAETR